MNITNEVRERINEIAAANGGHITADMVLADARRESSPLHACYDWNVESAAHEHWLDTSRRLIRSVRVVFKEERSVIRAMAYVRDPAMPSDRQGYVSVTKLRDDQDLSREALVNEFARAAGALRRARELAAALGMREQMDSMLDQIELWMLQADGAKQQPLAGHGGN